MIFVSNFAPPADAAFTGSERRFFVVHTDRATDNDYGATAMVRSAPPPDRPAIEWRMPFMITEPIRSLPRQLREVAHPKQKRVYGHARHDHRA